MDAKISRKYSNSGYLDVVTFFQDISGLAELVMIDRLIFINIIKCILMNLLTAWRKAINVFSAFQQPLMVTHSQCARYDLVVCRAHSTQKQFIRIWVICASEPYIFCLLMSP